MRLGASFFGSLAQKNPALAGFWIDTPTRRLVVASARVAGTLICYINTRALAPESIGNFAGRGAPTKRLCPLITPDGTPLLRKGVSIGLVYDRPLEPTIIIRKRHSSARTIPRCRRQPLLHGAPRSHQQNPKPRDDPQCFLHFILLLNAFLIREIYRQGNVGFNVGRLKFLVDSLLLFRLKFATGRTKGEHYGDKKTGAPVNLPSPCRGS